MSKLIDIKLLLVSSGKILKDKFFRINNYHEEEKYHLISEVDYEIEKLLIENLKEVYPDYSIFSEEFGDIDNKSNYRWIIDPLDGTANFIFGVPYFNISLALEYNNKIIEGYVYNPITEELYYSTELLNKSFLNDDEIKVSSTDSIEKSLVVFGFSANFNNIKRYYDEWKKTFEMSKKGLGLLSPALNICNVARGKTDCFIDFGCSMEGQSAAGLILKNAGDILKDYELTEWNHKTVGVFAANKNLFKEIKEI